MDSYKNGAITFRGYTHVFILLYAVIVPYSRVTFTQPFDFNI